MFKWFPFQDFFALRSTPPALRQPEQESNFVELQLKTAQMISVFLLSSANL